MKVDGLILKETRQKFFWNYTLSLQNAVIGTLALSKSVAAQLHADRDLSWLLFDTFPSSTFKKKASKAIKEIKKFAQKTIGTTYIRVDVELNKQIYNCGIQSVPRRIRVRIARNDGDIKNELYSLITVA
ncbi:60S ribosomal protein L31 [Forsythia ovata]|uniref:60S ribosomal protein L31 n=1 Tax=Forsythia ovata TaxID=205694 RepID=A0ABD1X3V4_9LAMI